MIRLSKKEIESGKKIMALPEIQRKAVLEAMRQLYLSGAFSSNKNAKTKK